MRISRTLLIILVAWCMALLIQPAEAQQSSEQRRRGVRGPGNEGRTNRTDGASSNANAAATGEDEEETQPDDDEQQRAAERAAQRTAARLTRGPYLQMGTTNSVIVRWRTEGLSGGGVRFGLTETNLKFTARANGALTEHIVMLTNLLPNTRYYYALATNTLAASNSPLTLLTNSFVTAPLIGTPKPTRIWVLGDPGTARPVQRHVRDGFRSFNGEHHVDLWLLLGDNAYQSGKDSEYQAGIFLPYREMLRNSVLWPALGNHDGGTANSETQSGVYYDIFSLPTLGQAGGVMSGTEAYYSYDYANIHFICLDSHDSERTRDGRMMRWLKSDLAANRQPWTIAYWHHPPYSKGSHDTDDLKDSDGRSRDMREVFNPVLEESGVDLVLCGHSHGYERSYLLDGHYDFSTNFSRRFTRSLGDGQIDGDGPYRRKSPRGSRSGTLYVVAGSSGQTSGIRNVHPVMQMAVNIAGSLVLDVEGLRLDGKLIDTNGWVRDSFTLVKQKHLIGENPREAAERKAFGSSVPSRLEPLLSPSSPEAFTYACLTNVIPADQERLFRTYTNTTNLVLKQRLALALAAVGDASVVSHFMGTLTNKLRGRVLSEEEENVRFAMVTGLGILAQRYETPLPLLRKGVSADWWMFRTNWVSSRPLPVSAAILAASTVQALGLSGRPEVSEFLKKAMKRELVFQEEQFTRDFTPEYRLATNRLEAVSQFSPAGWRRHVLSQELPAIQFR